MPHRPRFIFQNDLAAQVSSLVQDNWALQVGCRVGRVVFVDCDNSKQRQVRYIGYTDTQKIIQADKLCIVVGKPEFWGEGQKGQLRHFERLQPVKRRRLRIEQGKAAQCFKGVQTVRKMKKLAEDEYLHHPNVWLWIFMQMLV